MMAHTRTHTLSQTQRHTLTNTADHRRPGQRADSPVPLQPDERNQIVFGFRRKLRTDPIK